MILTWLILIPLGAGCLAWMSGRLGAAWARWTALAAMGADTALCAVLWIGAASGSLRPDGAGWLVEQKAPWIPSLGIGYHLGADGLSLVLVTLSALMGLVCVAVSWVEIRSRTASFHACLLWTLGGIIGVFLALDLFLFYVFWEIMLVPMYFLIGLWGHERRVYAAVKFFIFTLAGSLLMLVSIVGLVIAHARAFGSITFDYASLLGTPVPGGLGLWLTLGFVAAFAVKLPAVPIHTWLPDAHTQAPTAGSVILAALLLKTGAYGLLRFILPLFPGPSTHIAFWAMLVGVAGILYGALQAFGQTDLKRLVAYTSISHMGFVLLGVFSFNHLALQGTVLQMVCHALSTGGLFIVAGMLGHRLDTRELGAMGGLQQEVPRMGAAAAVFAMASLGLPGLGNFIAEILVLLGSFKANAPLAIVAAGGLVMSTVYSLRIIQQAFHGPKRKGARTADLSAREVAVVGVLIVVLVGLGLYPGPVFQSVDPSLRAIERVLSGTRPAAAPPPPVRAGAAGDTAPAHPRRAVLRSDSP